MAGSVIDEQLQKAMEESLKSEPKTFDQRNRDENLPVGLKNVGNTCYFNTFIQALFFLPNMR